LSSQRTSPLGLDLTRSRCTPAAPQQAEKESNPFIFGSQCIGKTLIQHPLSSATVRHILHLIRCSTLSPWLRDRLEALSVLRSYSHPPCGYCGRQSSNKPESLSHDQCSCQRRSGDNAQQLRLEASLRKRTLAVCGVSLG